MNNLLMLTKFYPYGTGEAFIENELKILSKYYDNILIIACEVSKEEKLVRELPNNVVAYKVETLGGKKQKLIDVFKGLSMKINNKEILQELKRCKNINEKVFLRYFEAKSRRVFNEIVNNDYLKIFNEEDFSIYSYWFFMTARVGSLIKERVDNKIPYMFTRAHRYDLYAEKNSLGYLPEREMLLEVYDEVFPCSHNGTEYLRERYPQYKDKINTAFLGTYDYGIGEESKDGIFRIVSCSRVEDLKRVDKIAEALTLLDKEGSKIEWTHIGDGSLFEELKTYVESNINHIKVRLRGGLKNKEVLKCYKENSIDLFLNVSSSEGLPVSIMEATSFGIPVVATDVGGTSEILRNKENGILINCDFSKEELGKIIEDFIKIKDSKEYADYRKSARAIWEECFQGVKNYNSLFQYTASKSEGSSHEYKIEDDIN